MASSALTSTTALDRLTRLRHAKSPNTLLDLQYQFNAVNNITQMIDGAGTHNYTYDTLDRLTAATHPSHPPANFAPRIRQSGRVASGIRSGL